LVTVHNAAIDGVLDRIEQDATAVARRMAAAARAEVAEYAAVRDPAFAAEVVAHSEDHVHGFVRCARSGHPPAGAELDFVRERGARRARELLSLDALLEAYLIGQRTVWESIVEAAGSSVDGLLVAQELTAVTFRYTHAINVAVSAAYVRESQALASEVERGRRDLLDALFAGRALDEPQTRRAEALGLRPDGPHFVVVAKASGGEDQQAPRLAARALALDHAFVVQRDDELLAVVPVYVRRGPREARATIAEAGERLARRHGVELRAGLSSVCDGLAEVARGYAEAGRALRHAEPGGAVAIEELALIDLLAGAADSTARHLVPAAAHRLAAEDERQSGALTATLRAYADSHLNVAKAAERLVVHPNTVHYRLRRVAAITGRDPRRFDDLVELLLAERLRSS
jgi:hypothetical protein